MVYQIEDNQLPNKTFGELHRVIKRGISSYSNKGSDLSVNLVNVRDIQHGQIITNTVERVSIKSTAAVEKSRLEPGDLVITVKGINFRAAVAGESQKGFVISANLIALTLTDEVIPQYVAAYLNSPLGQREIQARTAGATIQGLTTRALLEIPIPVIPMVQQKLLAEYMACQDEHAFLVKQELDLYASIKNAVVQQVVR